MPQRIIRGKERLKITNEVLLEIHSFHSWRFTVGYSLEHIADLKYLEEQEKKYAQVKELQKIKIKAGNKFLKGHLMLIEKSSEAKVLTSAPEAPDEFPERGIVIVSKYFGNIAQEEITRRARALILRYAFGIKGKKQNIDGNIGSTIRKLYNRHKIEFEELFKEVV